MSSLRFAPVDPIPVRSLSRSSHTSSLPDHRVQVLQNRLQSLVSNHQKALFIDKNGDVSVVRHELLDSMGELQDVLSESIDSRRYEVVKFMGQREDADARREALEQTKPDTESESVEFERDQAELKRIDTLISDLKSQMTQLQGERSVIKDKIKDRESRRVKRNQQFQVELTRRRTLPTRDQLTASINESQQQITKDEREMNALRDGRQVLADIFQFLGTTERQISTLLQSNTHNDTDLLNLLNCVIDALDVKVGEFQKDGWKLLEVVVMAEGEGYKAAKSMIQQRRQTTAGMNETQADDERPWTTNGRKMNDASTKTIDERDDQIEEEGEGELYTE